MLIHWEVLSIISCTVLQTHSFILKDPNYSPDYINHSFEQKPNLRKSFLDKREHKKVAARRVEIMDKYLSNDSVFVDGIMHEKVHMNYVHLDRVQEIENAYKNLINLNGIKFIYKRDHYWRTWRKVKYPDGDRNVCYKCHRSPNCKDCQYGGFWVIDEDPPCPYEIITTINSAQVCAINMRNSTNMSKPCPAVVLFNDILSSCDNPINTQWQLRRDYKTQVSERNLAVLCEGRDFCEISTYYLITPSHVTFRITNATNQVMYSKVMKENNNTYVCVQDCGVTDPIKKTVSKTDKPLIIDLIIGKKKREDKVYDDLDYNEGIEKVTSKNNYKKLKEAINNMEKAFDLHVEDKRKKTLTTTRSRVNRKNIKKVKQNVLKKDISQNLPMNDSDYHKLLVNNTYHHHHYKKSPTCSSLKHLMDEPLSEDIETYYNVS